MRVLALLIGFGTAAVCVRLGVWQLDRLAERRAWNADVEARMAAPAIALTSGLTSTPADSLRYRRVEARGTFAFADQRAEANRSFQGAPGVYVVTPLRFPDGSGVLVQRGFTYAADGMTADLAALGEPESTAVHGVLLLPTGRYAVHPESLTVGYPLLPLVVRRTDRPAGAPDALVAVPLPVLDEGPHRSYAVQWFAFATIAAVGGVILALRRGTSLRAPPGRSAPAD